MGDPKDSGVTGKDFARARKIGDVAPKPADIGTPGRTNLVGDAWIDHGSTCDGKDDKSPGCFLTDMQRLRLVIDLTDRIQTATNNYKFALSELQTGELLKKADDLPWVLSLAFDVFGLHAVKVIGKAVIALRAAGVEKLGSAMADIYLDDRSWQTRTEGVLRSIDDKAIETQVKTAFDPVKKSGVAAIKSAIGSQAKKEQNDVVAYIQRLAIQCDHEFKEFGRKIRAHATDADLVTIWNGFHESYHDEGTYRDALKEKIDAFRKSGIIEIGRQLAVSGKFPHSTRLRDKRVVWYQENGNKTLRYQAQESAFLTQSTEPRRSPDGSHGEFGVSYADAAQLGEPVPEEFIDVALERSEQLWGPTPLVLGKSANLPSYNLSLPPQHQRQPGVPPSSQGTRVPTQIPTPRPSKSVEPDIDALPDAFSQVKVK